MARETVIWWARRDLRIRHNIALTKAAHGGARVVAVFIIDPPLVADAGEKRLAFMFDAVRSLSESTGGALVVREGDPAKEVAAVAREVGATRVVVQADASPYAKRRDEQVARSVRLEATGGPWVCGPDEVLKIDGTPYMMFTPYFRKWRQVAVGTIGEPGMVSSMTFADGPGNATIENKPTQAIPATFPANESEGRRRFDAFMTGNIANYGTNRDRMDLDGTSALSPYFRFGLLSVQRAALEAMSVGGPGAEAWLTQLAWRDFYFSVLAHFPRVAFENFRPEYDQVDWLDDTRLFDAWCQGRTGYPIVDAAMRQLSETGWMHNRARMIVASFLSKDLLVDWRWGERWFMRHLIDGDLAANNGGWQWTAGTGTDAAPYFRVFNPVSQGLRFDPYGDYVRRWVPELRGLAGPAVHEPWKHAQAMDYGERIVEHDLARMRAIDAFQSARSLAR